MDETYSRVECFLDQLDHVGAEDVSLVSLPAADMDSRAAARSAAVAAAERAGLGRVMRDSREQARERVVHMYDRNGFQPTWAGLNWGRSLGTVADRVAVAAAVEDATIGTVALDLLPADEAEALLEPLRLIISMHPSEAPVRSQFAGTGWTARIASLLYLGFVASFSSVLGLYFGEIGWVLALAIVVAAGMLLLRGRSVR